MFLNSPVIIRVIFTLMIVVLLLRIDGHTRCWHWGSKEAGLYVLQHVPSKYFSPIVFEWWIQLFGMDGLDILNLGF